MTSLPRLTPKETSVSIIPSGPSETFRKSRRITRSMSSKTSANKGVSLSWDESLSHSAPGTSCSRHVRLDPLHPPKAKRTIYLETTDAHYQNELQTYLLKREQYHKFHRNWMRPFYGDKIEQEDYKKDVRESLKGQMDYKDEQHKTWMVERVKESESAFKHDSKCLTDDREAYKHSKIHLMKFRDENKKIMEEKEKQEKVTREKQFDQERELLRYNPINWSQSLR